MRTPIAGATTDETPWYRQFWPWFLIFLPACAVVGGILTVIVAARQADSLVVDDYYKEGLAINRDMERDTRAQRMGLTARIRYLPSQSLIQLELASTQYAEPDTLRLKLTHPTLADKDLDLRMTRMEAGRYEGHAPALPDANWHVMLTPPDESWRLAGRMLLSGEAAAQLP